MPEICPEALSRVRPVGKEPKTEIENVYGAVPPETAMPAPYELPTEPFGRLFVVIDSTVGVGVGLGEIVIEKPELAV